MSDTLTGVLSHSACCGVNFYIYDTTSRCSHADDIKDLDERFDSDKTSLWFNTLTDRSVMAIAGVALKNRAATPIIMDRLFIMRPH